MKLYLKKKIKIINYLINPISMQDLIKFIFHYQNRNKPISVCISNVHSCIESFLNKKFKIAHNTSDIAVADGKPIYWILKILNLKNIDHLPGYKVTEEICKMSIKKNYRIGFYGSKTKILNLLNKKLKKKFKGLKIVYNYAPPFRSLTEKEEKIIINNINQSKLDILFICLGCPKQELWMYRNKRKLRCKMLGIGAAVDFLSGNKVLPNKFFENMGLAWLIRLLSEPKRLLWRYLKSNTLFIILILLQLTGIKKFK